MNRKDLVPDLIAGLTTAIADIPDAMASAVLAGANPVYGLYAIMVGKPIGGLLTSSQFMTLAVASAMALTAGSALSGYSTRQYATALFTLTLLVVLSQLGDLSGYASEYSNKVVKAVDLLLHLNQVHGQTLAIGLLRVLLILVFDRTRLGNFSMLYGPTAHYPVPGSERSWSRPTLGPPRTSAPQSASPLYPLLLFALGTQRSTAVGLAPQIVGKQICRRAGLAAHAAMCVLVVDAHLVE